MQGELENLYREYRQGERKPLRKVSPTGKQGVPDPYLDGENDADVTSVNTCPKCGGFNISVDMATNKVECRDCSNKADKASRVDFQKMMEKSKEEEQQKIIDSLKTGGTFL